MADATRDLLMTDMLQAQADFRAVQDRLVAARDREPAEVREQLELERKLALERARQAENEVAAWDEAHRFFEEDAMAPDPMDVADTKPM